MYKDYPAAYQVSKGSALQVDTAFYERIRERVDQRTLIEQFEVPIRAGRAWKVPAGHVFRVTTPVGPQVGDFNVWNANDPRERLWAARTRQLQGAHVSTHDRLWSNLPFLRPLVTITDDSLASYGIDEHGGRLHDLLGTRCDPYVNRMLTGEDFHHHCHSNLTRAVLPHGLTEFDVHDVLNIEDNGYADNTDVFTVPEGEYFFMGDNRDNSQDSRFGQAVGGVGFVPAEFLIGRADRIVFSSAGRSMLFFWTWRADRFFKAVE